MINMFKVWISSLLCLGIFVAFLELIMPNSKFRKYVYSLVGIVTIITIISPMVNLYKNKSLETSMNNVINTLSENISANSNNDYYLKNSYQTTQSQLLKEQFITSIKKDIETKLTDKGIKVQKIEISLNENYDIQKIEINIKKIDSSTSTITTVNDIVGYINKEYDISYSKITVMESGV